MEELKSSSRRLTKKPPPGHSAYNANAVSANYSLDNTTPRFDNLSLRSQRSSGSLQRAPSAPQPRPNNKGAHVRGAASINPANFSNSSNSSLDRQVSAGPSPTLAGSEQFQFKAPPGFKGGKRFSNPVMGQHLNEKTSEEFIGAPFDGSGLLSHFDSSKASGYQNSLRRPPPPPLSHTSPDPRMMSPPLRQSQSFSTGDRMNEKMTPRVAENQLISPNRYSDESREPKNMALRKKTGFSGFMSGLVGSPRRVNISAPENPVHVTHVGYDNETGQFTVSSGRLIEKMCYH
jgi:p21-activated kinase 1